MRRWLWLPLGPGDLQTGLTGLPGTPRRGKGKFRVRVWGESFTCLYLGPEKGTLQWKCCYTATGDSSPTCFRNPGFSATWFTSPCQASRLHLSVSPVAPLLASLAFCSSFCCLLLSCCCVENKTLLCIYIARHRYSSIPILQVHSFSFQNQMGSYTLFLIDEEFQT